MNGRRGISPAARSRVAMRLWIGTTVFLLLGCTGKGPIFVGFVAQLTGVQAELGVQERNGVQMAAEEINRAGGVAGRPIELIVRDDLGTPEGAQAADRELIKGGVVAIIGHATSGQTMAGLAVTNPARMVMLSPTATTPKLKGLDDFFFRVTYSLEDRAQALAQHMVRGRHMTRVAALYDADNTAYSKSYLEAFASNYHSLGGRLVAQVAFSSKSQPDFAPLVARLRASHPEGLLILAADMDTALIAQRTRILGWPIPLFSTAWAQTEALINTGGRAVEGLEIEMANLSDDRVPEYLDFKKRYQARFGQAPSFSAALGYEAAQVLAHALQKTGGRAAGLPQALIGIRHFRGLIDSFSFDRFGDVIRPHHLGAIRDGKYVTFATKEAAKP